MIAGLEDITGGDLYIGDKRVNTTQPRDRGVAMVFQSYALYPHMSVYDNVGFGLRLNKTPRAERDAKIREAAKILQMEHLLERKPSQLSGGQRQRVAIGRAIVRNPDVFLFDEPLSNLDAALRGSMRMEISKLHNQLGATMIYVTHDQVEAMTLADKIVVLNAGVVQQIGSPLELYNSPANLFVAGFIGSPKMNLLNAKVLDLEDNAIVLGGPSLPQTRLVVGAPIKIEKGADVTFGVRPHHLVRDESGPIRGTVLLVEQLGNETIDKHEHDDKSQIVAALPGSAEIHLGDKLNFGFEPGAARLFGPDGEAIPLT